jgi:hypothetical protein
MVDITATDWHQKGYTDLILNVGVTFSKFKIKSAKNREGALCQYT